MDIKQYSIVDAAEKGIEFELLYPSFDPEDRGGKPTGVTFDIFGVGSRAFNAANDAIESYKQKCWSKGKTVDEDHLEKLMVNLVVSCVRGWDGFTSDGKPYPFSRANAEALLTDKDNKWIVNQLSDNIGDIKAMLEKK